MNFETTVSEVKDRLQTVSTQAQDVAKVSFETFKQAGDVVVAGVQDLVKTHTGAAKELYSAAKDSFDKAVADGLVAVAKNPIEYLPDGRESLVDAFNETVEVVTKSGENLAKVLKTGYGNITAKVLGKPAPRAGKPRAAAGRKTGRKTTVRKTVHKSAVAGDGATA